MHPRAQELLPLPSHSTTPILIRDIERYEADEDDDEHIDEQRQILRPGISMDRYSDFGAGDNLRYTDMYTSLSYLILRERSSSIMAQNAPHLRQAQRTHLASLSELDRVYQDETSRKREMVEEINEDRKRRQADFEPVAAYLEQRWLDGIRSMVDLGIERAQQ